VYRVPTNACPIRRGNSLIFHPICLAPDRHICTSADVDMGWRHAVPIMDTPTPSPALQLLPPLPPLSNTSHIDPAVSRVTCHSLKCIIRRMDDSEEAGYSLIGGAGHRYVNLTIYFYHNKSSHALRALSLTIDKTRLNVIYDRLIQLHTCSLHSTYG
jgi:hypothetical protein